MPLNARQRAYQREYYRKNRERKIAYLREYRRRTPYDKTKNNARGKMYYAANRDRLLSKGVAYRSANKARVAAWTKSWRERNPERSKALSRRNYEASRESILQRFRERRAANLELFKARTKAWRLRNPEKCMAIWYARQARKLNNGGSFTAVEWKHLLAMCGRVCLRCLKSVPLASDHIIPVSMGGSNHIFNMQPLCKPCNSWKHAKAIDYRPQAVRLFYSTHPENCE